jgi:hypothetical protein
MEGMGEEEKIRLQMDVLHKLNASTDALVYFPHILLPLYVIHS